MTEAVDVLVAGNGCEAVAEEAAKIAGVRTVLLAQNAKLAQELPEVLAYTAAHEAPGYSHIFFCATALGKAAMPRVAAQLDRSAVSDVVAVKGPKTFVRGIYAVHFSQLLRSTKMWWSERFARRPLSRLAKPTCRCGLKT